MHDDIWLVVNASLKIVVVTCIYQQQEIKRMIEGDTVVIAPIYIYIGMDMAIHYVKCP